MSSNKPQGPKLQDEPCCPQEVVQWAMRQPGVLLLAAPAVGPMLARIEDTKLQAIAAPRLETEADIIDGDIPFFV